MKHKYSLLTSLFLPVLCSIWFLYDESRKEINILITAGIGGNGELRIEGIDSGLLVKELKGDWDYEYFLTISPVNKLLLINYLQLRNIEVSNDHDLLHWFQENFSKNDCFSSIMAFLKKAEIKFETFFWE